MHTGFITRARLLGAAALLALVPAGAAAQSRAAFRVTLTADTARIGSAPVSGRLIILMSTTPPEEAGEPLRPDLDPEKVWIAAKEVTGLAPGSSVVIDADSLASPRPFSAAPRGKRYVMALLDRDHNANWSTLSPGDLVSPVDSVDALGTLDAPTPLALSGRIVGPRSLSAPSTEVVELTSPLLSAFWKRPVVLRAAVVTPPDSEAVATPAGPRFRAVYHISGWGGSHRMAFSRGQRQIAMMRDGGERGAVHVFLETQFVTGHPVFANSANNGPWADALMSELIPHLEQRYRLIPAANARHLTGHSSGGWATLWLQVNYPAFFGGTWSTAPDPVDFADFTGVDMRPGSRENYYFHADGTPRPFIKMDGVPRSTLQAYTRMEVVLGPAGQISAFETVFGPRGADGKPVQAIDRETGALNPRALEAWAAYDIRAILQRRWAELGPQLRGKLHIWVGDEDNFYLTAPTQRLCEFLKRAGSDATCEIVPGRDHFSLPGAYETYPKGLEYRFGQEMQRAFEASRR
jgi:S-formylglutathione hydrolase FrmB